MISLKDFQTVKTKKVIPLHIKGIDCGVISSGYCPKLTVIVGIKIQEKISGITYSSFDLELKDGDIILLLTSKGQRTVRVRTKTEKDYLEKLIQVVKETITLIK